MDYDLKHVRRIDYKNQPFQESVRQVVEVFGSDMVEVIEANDHHGLARRFPLFFPAPKTGVVTLDVLLLDLDSLADELDAPIKDLHIYERQNLNVSERSFVLAGNSAYSDEEVIPNVVQAYVLPV